MVSRWDVLTAHLMVRWGMSKQAILRALEDDGLASPEETAVIRTRRVEDLMAEAGLTEQWQALCAGQSEPCGSPWLVSRALEAYSHGWVGAHVVADLLDQDVETTRAQLVAQGWAEPNAYTGLINLLRPEEPGRWVTADGPEREDGLDLLG